MIVNSKGARLLSLVLALALVTLGCATLQGKSGGALKTETHSVDLGEATSVRMQLTMNMGKLTINSGSDKLAEGTFSYNVPDWRPKVDYTVTGSQGLLVINQPDEGGMVVVKDAQNTWDLRLNDAVPLDLDISTGASESVLNLQDLQLAKVNIQTGAGKTTVDLSGNWDHDLMVHIQGGIGKVEVKLPSGMGVTVEAQSGIGNVNVQGLSKQGNRYVNQAYGTAANTLTLTIEAGVGTIDLSVP